MKYGNRRRVMERQYSVRIQMSVERVSDQYRAVAGAWIGKEWVDEIRLFEARETAPSKAEAAIACLNKLEPRLNERWRKTHFDAEGQYYMFGVEPKSIEN